MTYDLIVALAAFAFVTSITPGPNNLMLMASGANFGFRRTIPHMLGVGLGFTVMIVLVGVGLAQIFEAYPEARTALKIISVIYLLYLAWKIANAAAPTSAEEAGTPITFIQAALFQWVNPKAWSMAFSIGGHTCAGSDHLTSARADAARPTAPMSRKETRSFHRIPTIPIVIQLT